MTNKRLNSQVENLCRGYIHAIRGSEVTGNGGPWVRKSESFSSCEVEVLRNGFSEKSANQSNRLGRVTVSSRGLVSIEHGGNQSFTDYLKHEFDKVGILYQIADKEGNAVLVD